MNPESINFGTLMQGKALILSAPVKVAGLAATIDALRRIDEASNLGQFCYMPIRFSYRKRPSTIDKLLLAFYSLVIGELQGNTPSHGSFIFGPNLQHQRIKLKALQARVRSLVEDVRSSLQLPTPVMLNQHCPTCEFRAQCREEAESNDSLSLLGGISDREIARYNRNGIFTVNQLSYTFRYRRPSKRAKRPSKPHHFSLQALALRTQKVHVHGTPSITKSDTAIYFDIEGLPDFDFYYLIGMLRVRRDTADYRSFWADSEQDQAEMFQQFADAVQQFPKSQLYHYGNYDITALKRARALCKPSYEQHLNSMIDSSNNVLSVVHSHVYFPTYSNTLKEVATHLGFNWRHPEASGAHSIIWREQWGEAADPSLKARLIGYNEDDCMALRVVSDFIRSLTVAEPHELASKDTSADVVNTSDFVKPSRKWGRPTFVLQNLERASACAYFDYQRERVFVRTSRRIAGIQKARTKHRQLRVNKLIELSAMKCPYCGSKEIKRTQRLNRVSIDLLFSRSGVKRWVIQYKGARHLCNQCRRTFASEGWPTRRRKYGENLAKWSIYLNVACKQTMYNVRDTLHDVFGIAITRSSLYQLKREVCSSYVGTYEQIRKHVLASPVLYVDETDVAIRNTKGYVWIFATLDAVWYTYKESRSGEFLKEFLSGFDGVIVSDFYSAYDSTGCRQQKCLLHLLRDFNYDLKCNPFDEEFKSIASEFGSVLRAIVETIDKYGLRKRHLRKHKKAAARFVERVSEGPLSSELSLKYQKRFKKYGDRLFTFLEFDGVPWNNNGAEHAAKRFVKYKRINDGLFTEQSLGESLVMLSISETCRHNGVSFLRFLLDGSTDLASLTGG
jgi:predicted RecB family nuclease